MVTSVRADPLRTVSYRPVLDIKSQFLAWLADPCDVSHIADHVDLKLPRPMEHGQGRQAILEQWVWPVQKAFSNPEWTPLLVGCSHHDSADWLAAMVEVTGDQVVEFYGVPKGRNRRLSMGVFVRHCDGQFDRIRLLFDLPGLAHQAGLAWFPPFEGRDLPHPRPPYLTQSDSADTLRSRQLVESLIGGLNHLQQGQLSSMPQRDYWCQDMGWFGPHGIGGACGFEEYQRFAQGPSVASFPNRRGTWPKEAFVVDGRMAAFTAWPSLVGDFTGQPFRGLAPTGGGITQNIMDFYVTRSGRLWRNWVFIDLIDFAEQCGVDVREPDWWRA